MVFHALDPPSTNFINGVVPYSEIEHNGSRLFDNIPSGRKSGFKVHLYSDTLWM
jgi:hypothetical protein